MTQMAWSKALTLSELLGELVDLVGIEPTTSSMPWKRAPSCATGPLEEGIPPLRDATILAQRTLDSQTGEVARSIGLSVHQPVNPVRPKE